MDTEMSLDRVERPYPVQPFIMRPSVGQTGKVLGGAFVAGAAYIALRLIRLSQDSSSRWFLVLLVVMLGLIAAGYLLFFSRARIEIDHERILKVGAFGGRRAYALQDVGGIAFRTVRQPMSRTGDLHLGVIYGRDGRGLFTFSVRLWDPGEVGRLAAMFGSRYDEAGPSVSRREFEREFPGAFNIWERHPYILGGVLAIVLTVGAVLLISLRG